MPVGYADIDAGFVYVTPPRLVTEADIDAFSTLSGDVGPVHRYSAWAVTNTTFPSRVAHGWLVSSIAGCLPTGDEGWRVIALLEASRSFLRPVFPGDTVHTEFEVMSKWLSSGRPGFGTVHLEVRVRNQELDVVQRGRDLILMAGAGNE